MMLDRSKKSAAWAVPAAVLLTVALLSATSFTGIGNTTGVRISASVVSALSLISGVGCMGLALRGMTRAALTGTGNRLQRQTEALNAAQERRHVELMEQITHAQEKWPIVLREHEQVSKALGSLARSLRLQTEAITVIRKQTRASAEGIEQGNVQMLATHEAVLDSRTTSRKLLNVVRGESKISREAIAQLDEDVQSSLSKLEDVEAGQRRVLNFLRREGNIQVVLDRLQAAERRLLTSVEGSALTVAQEFAEYGEQRDDRILGEILKSSEGLDHLRVGFDVLENEARTASSQTNLLTAEIGSVSEMIGEVSGSIVDLGAKNTNAMRDLAGVISTTLDRMESSIHQELQACVASAIEMQNEGEPERTKVDVFPALNSLVRLTDVLKNDVKALHRHVDRASIDTVRQTEALMQLLPRMSYDSRRLPPSGGFAMTPDSLLLLADLIAGHEPKTIVELGSGTSTIWMGLMAADAGRSIVSIEHLEEYLAKTQHDLADFGLTGVVDLRLAELEQTEVVGGNKLWYRREAFEDIASIDMLIVDGPPESTGPTPRSPSFPLLREKLSDHALLIVDDVHRGQEAQMVEEWLESDRDLRRTPWESSRTSVLEYRRNRPESSDSESK